MSWKEDLGVFIDHGLHGQAISLLKKVLAHIKDTYSGNTLIMISASHNGLERKKGQGTMRSDDIDREEAKIRLRLLDFSKKFDDFDFDHGIPIPPPPPLPPPSEEPGDPVKKILFLGFNPPDTEGLNINGEVLAIMKRLKKKTDVYEMDNEMTTTVDNILEFLFVGKPNILHMSGHGTHASSNGDHPAGLVLDDGEGDNLIISATDIGEIIGEIVKKNPIDLVLINACESVPVAKAVGQHVDYVVGMAGKIEDESALDFSSAFYLGLANDHDVPTAFFFAKKQLKMKKKQGWDLLSLHGRKVEGE